jgi:hypothetical protein
LQRRRFGRPSTDRLAVIPTELVERFGEPEGLIIAAASFARLSVPTLTLQAEQLPARISGLRECAELPASLNSSL